MSVKLYGLWNVELVPGAKDREQLLEMARQGLLKKGATVQLIGTEERITYDEMIRRNSADRLTLGGRLKKAGTILKAALTVVMVAILFMARFGAVYNSYNDNSNSDRIPGAFKDALAKWHRDHPTPMTVPASSTNSIAP